MNAPVNARVLQRNPEPKQERTARGIALHKLVWLISFGVVCATIGRAQANPSTSDLIDKTAPAFNRVDLNHHPLSLKAYRGKVVLLNFWATWCAPCQVEMPIFVKWQQTYGKGGLQIIGISMDDDSDLAKKADLKLRLNYPVAMGDVKLGDLYGGILGLPESFLIDRHGVIRAEFHGEANLHEIETKMRALLSER